MPKLKGPSESGMIKRRTSVVNDEMKSESSLACSEFSSARTLSSNTSSMPVLFDPNSNNDEDRDKRSDNDDDAEYEHDDMVMTMRDKKMMRTSKLGRMRGGSLSSIGTSVEENESNEDLFDRVNFLDSGVDDEKSSSASYLQRKGSISWFSVQKKGNESLLIRPNGLPWTDDHLKLLYLISKYSHCARSREEKECWIRKTSLLVLIYEGIVSGAFTYDYAPVCEFIGKRHLIFNSSEEGKDDIDDLRDGLLVNGLKLSSREYSSITAYQISPKGMRILELVPPLLREQINDFILTPHSTSEIEDLLQVRWEDDCFYLVGKNDFKEKSSVTETEDVSYVSSPYLPACLLHSRGAQWQLLSNKHRIRESAAGTCNIRDQLSEYITLNSIKLLVGEWVPFGSNQIAALNDKLGSTERVKGGLFTALVDTEPDDTQFQCNTGLTSVRIVEFDVCNYLAFQAEINYPEKDGIVQVEHFGVSTASDGSICYGLKVESILDRTKNLSVDHLSRLMIDVQQDSSMIMDSLISVYQRSLLNMMFNGDSENREKFVIIIAESISPQKRAEDYLDKEDCENELKQVLGDTQSAHSLGENELLVIGRRGILVVGLQATRFEPLLSIYLSLMSKTIFVSHFFQRTFTLHETLKIIHESIDLHEKDPNSISRIRKMLSDTAREIIQLEEILSYLSESLDLFDLPNAPVENSKTDEATVKLWKILRPDMQLTNLKHRLTDMKKNIKGCGLEMTYLRDGCNVLSENRSFRLQEDLQTNTRNLEDVFRSNERASSSLEMMQVILSGSLAFEILDRITGEWSVTELPWAQEWIVNPLMKKPGVWFGLNMLVWGIIAWGLIVFMRYLSNSAGNVQTLRIKPNLRIKYKYMNDFLKEKPLMEEVSERDTSSTMIRKVSWVEDAARAEFWGGPPPKIEIQMDTSNGFLLQAYFCMEKGVSGRRSEDTIVNTFIADLSEHNVIDSTKCTFNSIVNTETSRKLNVPASSTMYNRESPLSTLK